jgi:hypothetical protein
MGDLIFAFVHLAGLLAVLGYAVYSLVRGNAARFAVIVALLAVYYFLVLDKAVRKEIARRKSLKRTK